MKTKLSDYKEAQAANYVKLMKLMPDRAEPLQGLLQIYRELKQSDKVAEYEFKLEELKIKYRKRMEISPGGREHLQMLDKHSVMPFAELEGRYKSFDEYFDETTALDIDDPEAHCELAGEYEANGLTEIANELCAALESRGFKRHLIFAWRANALASNNQIEMAVPYWQKALKLNPENIDALIGLAYYNLSQNDLGSAIGYLEPAYRQQRDNEQIIFFLIESYIAVGRLDDADALIPILREKDPDSATEFAAEIIVARTIANGHGNEPIGQA